MNDANQQERPANRLASETSPYLQQHSRNPVDWYPWGPEALERAKAEDRPIFLSIGYSACHWCHVMERETFEDSAAAAAMNVHFINVKVDREERPDLDQIYMSAVQMMTGRGGWPMSVWLKPDLTPFYGGTYFPPTSRHGLPAFRDLTLALAEAWRTKRSEIDRVSGELTQKIREVGGVGVAEDAPSLDLVAAAGRQLARHFDRVHGGLGSAPKFPHSVECRLLFQAAELVDDPQLRDVALYSIERMIRGGIFDQLGGGFHRYSTDRFWLAPHFEKMLYDNALIPLACLEAWQLTRRDLFRDAAKATFDYVVREMSSPSGPFYSSQDADSEGEEGRFFVWTQAEVLLILGSKAGPRFCRCYDVTAAGNWEGRAILHLPVPIEELAEREKVPLEELRADLAAARALLFAEREKRIRPGRDEKILTAWNGMMIHALAVGGQVLDERLYIDAAAAAAEEILKVLRTPEGRLLRTARDGRAKLLAYLEDYACLANALVSLYEATFEPNWLAEAQKLADQMFSLFWDEAEGGFFFTGVDHEELITRSKDPRDGATPSGNAMAATVFVRLALLVGGNDYGGLADRMFQLFHRQMKDEPMVSGQLLLALRMHLGPTDQIAVVEGADPEEARRVLTELRQTFSPNKVVAMLRKGFPDEKSVPLLEGRAVDSSETTVYLCREFVCSTPLRGTSAFELHWTGIQHGSRP